MWFFAVSAFAETLIEAEVDKTQMTTDEMITYKVTISSAQKNIPAPQIPEFEGFDVLSQIQSSSFSLGRNESKADLVFTYILVPQEAGNINIPPSQIKVKGKTYSSEAFEIEVKQGKIKPALPDDTGPGSEQPLKITL